MKFENTEVTGFENAILGARLPMCKDLEEAKVKSDTGWIDDWKNGEFYKGDRLDQDSEAGVVKVIGEKDLDLLKRLIKADDKIGQPNSKFLRMIHAQVCITAPLYWWKEMDTYKVGTVANSTSTMHKLASTPITMDCFEMSDFADSNEESNHYNLYTKNMWSKLIDHLEALRKEFNETKDKRYWKELIRLLPESWLQTRMFDCDYATLRNIYCWRVKIPHKLTEWKQFGDWVESLPYAEDVIIN